MSALNSELNPLLFLGTDMHSLTEAEMNELRSLADRCKLAYLAKEYGTSDELRAELVAWGAWPPEQGWHPVNEAPEHRQARLARR